MHSGDDAAFSAAIIPDLLFGVSSFQGTIVRLDARAGHVCADFHPNLFALMKPKIGIGQSHRLFPPTNVQTEVCRLGSRTTTLRMFVP